MCNTYCFSTATVVTPTRLNVTVNLHGLSCFNTDIGGVVLVDNTFWLFNPYPTAFPYGNGMVLHFYQQQESSTTKTVHKVINKGLKTYV